MGRSCCSRNVERKSGDGDVDAHADDGVSIRDGVSKDRMLSVHDPELRHGHKSSRRHFNGHKAAIVVDTDSQLITAVDVLPGNAPDNLGALELVEQSEASTGAPVEETMGDAAYGDGGTRQAFTDAGRQLVAKVPGRPNRKHFPKNCRWPCQATYEECKSDCACRHTGRSSLALRARARIRPGYAQVRMNVAPLRR